MIKILCSADWHIMLHKKKVPYKWQEQRFKSFFRKLLGMEANHDIHVIAGDVFDKKPEPDEICLFLSYINSVTIPTYIIPGNHESTRKGESFFEYFTQDNAIKNPLVKIFTKNSRVEFQNQGIQFFPYGEMEIDNLPSYTSGDILVTHIRGEVPPHITAEYDFDRLSPWKLILLGDLHFYHQYKDTNAYYPGSPLNVSFDRDDTRQYGVLSIDLVDSSNYSVHFVDLRLPKLLRKRINISEEMKQDETNHTVYEVTGSIDELSMMKNSELLDKKIADSSTESATLDLKNKNLIEELDLYLDFIQVKEKQAVLDEFKKLKIEE